MRTGAKRRLPLEEKARPQGAGRTGHTIRKETGDERAMNDRLVAKRFIKIVLMLLITLVSTAVLSFLHGRFMDEMVIYLAVDLVFFALFMFVLEQGRMQKKIAGNKETIFQRVLLGYLFVWVIAIAGSFLPEFLKPAILIPIFMVAFGTQKIAMYVGVFVNVILCLIVGKNPQELVLYCLMTLLGCMISEAFENRKLQFWYGLVVFFVCAILPYMFYYLTYREGATKLLLYGAVEGLVLLLFLLMFYPKIAARSQVEILDMLSDILDEAYPVSRELFNFSKADYEHAKRVSALAAKCACLVDANESVCAAAGFYYRIGILDGESIVDGGIHIAQRECFPEDVIRIISEYNGERELPSSTESAVVHMVDGLIKKLEVLDSQTMSSEWNQDMVIYQTLNDFSAQGLYDKSGLSMNMFLKIREYLVNEKALLERRE